MTGLRKRPISLIKTGLLGGVGRAQAISQGRLEEAVVRVTSWIRWLAGRF